MRENADLRAALPELLGATRGVVAASYFGSVAKGTSDRFSDIDLVVEASGEAGLEVVRRLHHAFTVVLFRPFSERRLPSGRYWFAETNPFARLDISFFDAVEYPSLLREGRGVAQPPFKDVLLKRGTGPAVEGVELPTWSDEDYEWAGLLREHQEVMKGVARENWILSKRVLSPLDLAAAGGSEEGPVAGKLSARSLEVLSSSA